MKVKHSAVLVTIIHRQYPQPAHHNDAYANLLILIFSHDNDELQINLLNLPRQKMLAILIHFIDE